MIINNMGSFQRTEFGTQAVGGQFYLALLTGNIGKPGTGVCDAGGVTQMGKFGGPIPAPKAKPAKVAPIPTAKLGEYILADKPHKINVWYSQTCGPLGQWPNANKVRQALEKVPFVVVAENLMTPTAMYADVVLPATTVFEYDSVTAGARNHYVQLSEKAVEPQGEAKPDYWIIAQLAKRLGFEKEFDLTPRQMIDNVLKPSGITYEELKKGPVCPAHTDRWVPFAGGVFKTPNGKANFFCEPWAAKGFKPVVSYYPVVESPKGSPELAKRFPLMAIQRKVIRNIHTSHQNNEWLLQIHKKAPTVWLHPADAKARGIANGDSIIVYNDRGEYNARALVTRNIVPHTVSLENGWWMNKRLFMHECG
jgi:anaerobic selenocysteine-containing dehydrogenase